MRPSYRPRNQNSHGNHRGPGRGYGGGAGLALMSGGAARVTAPRPVQTSSLKAESGVFDLTTILVPAASKEKGGTWGRGACVTGTDAKLPDRAPSAAAPSSLIAAAPGKQLIASRDVASPTSSERSSSPEAESASPAGRDETAVWAPAAPALVGVGPTRGGSIDSYHRPHGVDPYSETSRDGLRYQQAPVHQGQASSVRTSPRAASSPVPSPLSGELFPPLGQQDPIAEKRHGSFGASSGSGPALRREVSSERSMDAASLMAPSSLVGASSDAPAPSVFQTPPPDEADTEEERERRRRALALEQQRLILEQVEAARAAKTGKKGVATSHQPVSVIMRRSSNHDPHKDHEKEVGKDAKSAPHPVQPRVTRKGPRTKGKLYSRLADGSLVEEGSGDTLPGSPVDGNGANGNAKDDERVAASAAGPAATKASNGQADPSSKGKPSAKKNWGSKNRRPKKHQVAALVDR